MNKILKKSILCSFLLLSFYNLFSLQLGDNSKKNQLYPKKVMENVEVVTVGDTYSIALKKDKTLWGTGIFVESPRFLKNTEKGLDSFFCIARNIVDIKHSVFIDQQGNANILKSDDYSFFNAKLSPITSDVLDIDDRGNITAILKKDNTLWIKGKKLISIDYKYNYSEYSDDLEFVDSGVIAFSCAKDTLVYIKKNKTVWMIGDNLDKKVVNSFDRVITKPELITKKMKACFVDKEIYLINTSDELFTIKKGELIRLDTNVRKIQKNFYIKTDGSLYAFGFAEYGALGIGNSNQSDAKPTYVMNNVKKVKGNDYHSLILTNDCKLYSCGGGYCNYGCIGNGTTQKQDKPVFIMEDVKDFDISNYHSMVIKNDDSLWAFGLNNYNEHELNF